MIRKKGCAFDDRALAAADARKRPIAPVELVATIALALSTVIAVTAVTIGIARADGRDADEANRARHEQRGRDPVA